MPKIKVGSHRFSRYLHFIEQVCLLIQLQHVCDTKLSIFSSFTEVTLNLLFFGYSIELHLQNCDTPEYDKNLTMVIFG